MADRQQTVGPGSGNMEDRKTEPRVMLRDPGSLPTTAHRTTERERTDVLIDLCTSADPGYFHENFGTRRSDLS